ncbi:MAG: hypothetical protein NWQ54_08210 [Paraglaciecola sp.]|uniref:hypothetical protein n=1 Tax=Paraglaciecola sp. TaxID=1920173 RepID=UPI00273E1E4F|nr:hypothetical protein [Paraglaciecola sp.]MDP5030008.1 hypothetical protein [Paraglaciecola sp.]MDP5039583.1 hypothetical protein [Paraglaciecola sp.]MDP5130854.1 hypothetical protein [Paraglaciecola sp.]
MVLTVNDEKHPGKVAGVFEQESSAQAAVNLLKSKGDFTAEEVALVVPKDESFAQKVEPDDKGIGRTLITSHLRFGAVGLALGLIVAAILSQYGPALTTSSPVMVFIALAMGGTFLGLMLAGLMTLRPDHDGVINKTRQATNNHQWTVIVQTKNDDQNKRARELLGSAALSVSDTF